jgi:probable F420-dependent oxidoreductase
MREDRCVSANGMRVGIVYPQTELRGDPDAVRRIGRATESHGFDHLLVYDHVVGAVHENREPPLWGPYTDAHPFHDPFVMLAYLAGITERIELATGVIILPQRQTALVAKQCADLDLLSGERLRLGVGVGWNYVEYDALGEDFATRGKRANEQIGLLRRLWTEPLLSYDGEFDTMDRGCITPRPNRSIPIWVGGFGPAAFHRAATLGDGFMFAGAMDRCVEGWTDLSQRLRDQGRTVEGFGLDLVTTSCKSVDDVERAVERWAGIGGTHISIVTMGMGLDSTEAHLDFVGQVATRVVAT